MDKRKMKKLLILNLPYFLVGLFATNLGEAWRLAEGADSSAKILSFFHALPIALNNPFPSFHPLDLLIGILCGAGLRLAVYDLDEINHNPYELAAYLTVKFEDYTRDEVQATLQWLFEQQYELTLTEVVEIRTRTTSSTDPETGETTTEEEDYEYYILNVKLRNKGLNSVISNSGLSEDDMERYRILLQTRGNRPDIFGNDIYATPGGEYTDYDIPGEALTDTRFANMIREAEKYLGYPYVWGGSSPSTSFDCSGFVSYVINHCGNGWSVGRLTANGLMGVCDIIPKSSAKPGDLIFFQGTYDTSGASHVGIYVGNGMMIHCGNPISYASIESNYWQQHFYCFGRIRN